MKKLIIGGCVKNVGRFLPKMFENINLLREWFDEVKVVFAYDNSADDTLVKLEDYRYKNPKDVDLLMCQNHHKLRTVNIASARNSILHHIQKTYSNYDLLCLIDCDDIISAPFIKTTFQKAIALYDKWDCLSFNRNAYYDIWALRYDPYLCSCWGFGEHSRNLIPIIQGDIGNKLNHLKDDELLEVNSAFNGIALYKLNIMGDIRFDGLYHHNIEFVNPFEYNYEGSIDDCEHVNFYANARKKYPNLRVMISPLKPY
jgi:hypothetical protein